MAKDYDIEGAFRAIENELLNSMIRNLKHHRAEETKEGFEWTSWQTEQLNSLRQYRAQNKKKFTKQFAEINQKIEEGIRQSKHQGKMDEEISILEAIKQGFKAKRSSSVMQGAFFQLNERKLEALIKATTDDMKKAERAMLRMADDQYRKVIFNAQVYANTGAGTYEQAVDMATRDFLSRGINCVQYKNGAQVNIASYAAMAIRTANTRAYLQGEGEKRKEWGISTVIVNRRGRACLKCLKWVGKVLIDDVWSGGKASDGAYPLMSTALEQGLYHPNCKDGHTTYFEGITEVKPLTADEIEKAKASYMIEQKINYANRQADRFKRLADYSLDEENQRKYGLKAEEWAERQFRLAHFKTDGDMYRHIETAQKTFEDVTEEYLRKATPGKGIIEFDVDAMEKDKEICRWLHDIFGGDLYCLAEKPQVGKMPDAKWNGVYWEFKAPTTLNAIDSRIRKAQNQLQEALDRDNKSNALRGMVVDISDRTISREDAITEIEIRTRSRLKGSTDVIIREGNRLLKVLRFRK